MSDRPDFCTKRGCKAYSESGCPSCERDAATQALTDMGCELREGVWMKSNQCECCACCCDQNHADMPVEWLPITRPSGGEGGAG